MVSEIIRYVTPVIHMRRTAKADAELGGKHDQKGRQGRRSGTSPATATPTRSTTPTSFIIDRPRPRQHLSFGFGIHRCVGNRLAELQLRILWEEILPRFPVIEVVGPARRDLFQLHPRHPLAAGAHPGLKSEDGRPRDAG